MNPLNLSGPAFLLLWVAGWGVVIGIAYLLRRHHARTQVARDATAVAAALHPTEIAFLAGGTRRAVEAAVLALEHRGIVTLDAGGVTLVGARPKRLERDGVYRGFVEDAPLSAAEHHVLEAAPTTMPALVNAPVLERRLFDALVAEELLVGKRAARWLASWTLPFAWFGVGVAKVATGVARDRSVGLLVLLLGVAVWLVPRAVRVPRLTTHGEAVVAKLIASNQGLAATARVAPALVDASDLMLAYGLFGPEILAAPMATLMPSAAAPTSWWNSGGTSGCGSSCGGGGGCGGGCGGCS